MGFSRARQGLLRLTHLLILSTTTLTFCASPIPRDDRLGSKPTGGSIVTKPIEQILKENTDRWMALPGVVGTAQGEADGKPCVLVLVIEKTEHLVEAIPDSIDGYPILLHETGEIRARE